MGWWVWAMRSRGPLVVERASFRLLLWTTLGVGAATLVLVPVLRAAHGAAPGWDALTTSMSLGAQLLLNLKRLETWYVWIAVDVIYVPLYFSRDLNLTALVYVVFNTFFSLLTQEEQVSSFRSVARHLTPDGAFVMQTFVPDVATFDPHHQGVEIESVGIDEITLEMSSHDVVAQRTDGQYVLLRQGDVRLFPVRIRYAYVSELDLMARLAGLQLRERWGSWRREPFPSPHRSHISVWEPAGPP